LRINELSLENDGAVADEEGNFPPWVELHNLSASDVALGGIPLSDDLLDIGKWEIPCADDVIVPANGFLVLFLDGQADRLGGRHANFVPQPAFNGEIQFVLNGGTDIVFFPAEELAPGEAAGRSPDGDGIFQVLVSPTPGAANSAPARPLVGEFVRADGTLDHRVDISDMTFLLKVLFQSEPRPQCADRLDANDDGTVTIADSSYIGNALFFAGPTFPPPYPAAGIDPTADDLPCPP
jgi:hypothetical protein